MLMNRNHSDMTAYNAYNPFRVLEDMERSFWKDNSMAELKTDIRDKGSEYLLEVDLPGFKKEDIHVDLDNECLTITAERHSEFEDNDKKNNFVRCERSYGSFTRSFDMTGVDTEQIKGAFENGVLKLTLPKLKESSPIVRSISIE